MTHVGWVDVLALALGLAVCVVLAFLVSPLATQSDPDMVWEGRVAVGFAALVYVGPLWLGQAASTLFAALADGGICRVGSGAGWWWPRCSAPHRLRPRWPEGRHASFAAVLPILICI